MKSRLMFLLALILAGPAAPGFAAPRSGEAGDIPPLERARKLKAEGHYPQAVGFYEKALSIDPKNADVTFELAQTHAWARNDRRALELYDAIIERHPNYVDAYLGKAFVLYWEERLEESEEFFRKTIDIAPDYADAQMGLARLLVLKGDFSQAIPIYESQLQKSPDDVNLLKDLARANRDAGKVKEAIEIFNRALKLDPARSDIRAELGQALTRVQRLDDAITELEKALAMKSSNVDDYVALGRVYSYKNRLEDAQRLYKEALKKDPANMDALNGLARTYGYAHDWKKAERAYQDVLLKDPSNLEARQGLEEIRNARGFEFNARYSYARFRTDDLDDPPPLVTEDFGPDAEWTYRKDPDRSFYFRAGRFMSTEKDLSDGLITYLVSRSEIGAGTRLRLPWGLRFSGRLDRVEFKDQNSGAYYLSRPGKTAVGAGFALIEKEVWKNVITAYASRSAFVREVPGMYYWDPAAYHQYSVADDIHWTDEISTLFEAGENFFPYISRRQADARGRARYRAKNLPLVLEWQSRYRSDPDQWNHTALLTVKSVIVPRRLAAEIRPSVDRDTLADITGWGAECLVSWTVVPRLRVYPSVTYRKDYGFKGNALYGNIYVGYEF